MYIALTMIEFAITASLMINLLKWVDESFKSLRFKVKVLQMFSGKTGYITGFLLNLCISSLMSKFTGGGLTAGFANLGSSVIVAIVFPRYVNWKYDIESMLSTIESEKEAKVAEKVRRKASKLKVAV